MGLSKEQIAAICDERLYLWKARQVAENSCPVMLLGCEQLHQNGTWSIQVMENFTDEQIVRTLESMLAIFRQKMAQKMFGVGQRSDLQ